LEHGRPNHARVIRVNEQRVRNKVCHLPRNFFLKSKPDFVSSTNLLFALSNVVVINQFFFLAESLYHLTLARYFAFLAAFKMGVNVQNLQSHPRSQHNIRSRACGKIVSSPPRCLRCAPAARYFHLCRDAYCKRAHDTLLPCREPLVQI